MRPQVAFALGAMVLPLLACSDDDCTGPETGVRIVATDSSTGKVISPNLLVIRQGDVGKRCAETTADACVVEAPPGDVTFTVTASGFAQGTVKATVPKAGDGCVGVIGAGIALTKV